jgi:DMSO/TMAO reductase YedYZ molybdopterin-dependent catalytic subunit
MRARLVDWSLLCLVLFEAASGFYTFTQGRPENIWFFTLHGAAGLALVLLLFWKLRRVWVRIVDRRRWDAGTPAALAALGFVLLTLGSGLVWTLWHWPLGYPNGLNWHVVFGVALVLFTVLHMLRRFKPLRRADLRGRRAVLGSLAVLATGSALWAGQQELAQVAGLPGAWRRFTGSRTVGQTPGLTFPATIWAFDHPAPYALENWQLDVSDWTGRRRSFGAAELARAPRQALEATLDCTSGWYTQQVWRGIPLAWLLAQAELPPGATAVSFVSATGYRWSVPLAEAQTLLLATEVGGVPLDHGHGAPLRLVAPGRRGYQWVKWVRAVHVLNAPDWGQWGAIFTSGF